MGLSFEQFPYRTSSEMSASSAAPTSRPELKLVDAAPANESSASAVRQDAADTAG